LHFPYFDEYDFFMNLGYWRHLILTRFFPLFFLFLTSCAYRWGAPDRTLPGGHRLVYIPIFRNLTSEPGIEVDFTNSLRREFERSHIARVSNTENADAEIIGEITQLSYRPETLKEGDTLPTGTVLVTRYNIVIDLKITLKKKADQSVLWQGDFTSQRVYIAPQVTTAVVNTVNPLYNLSARRQNIQVISGLMMSEAHDRLTENF